MSRPAMAITLAGNAASSYSYTTFGNQNVNASQSIPGQANRIWLSKFTCPHTGKITGMHVKVKTHAATSIKFVIAADSAGVPGSVLGVSSGVSVNVTNGATVNSAAMNVSVVSGDLHLGIVSKSGGYPAFAGDYSGTLERSDSFNYTSPPSTVGTLADNETGNELAIWADLKF